MLLRVWNYNIYAYCLNKDYVYDYGRSIIQKIEFFVKVWNESLGFWISFFRMTTELFLARLKRVKFLRNTRIIKWDIQSTFFWALFTEILIFSVWSFITVSRILSQIKDRRTVFWIVRTYLCLETADMKMMILMLLRMIQI